jgi:His/Glu/Gln/Arg/opine family amino acid ABC transporter permease subunit
MNAADLLSLLDGMRITILVSLSAVCIGVPLGLVLALIRWYRVPLLDPMVATLVSLLRAIPSVTLVLLVYFALPGLGFAPDRLEAAIAVLAVGTMAFDCEIWRAALIAFPRDQLDAAIACGMRRDLRFRRIVLPQVFRACLPALMNEVTLIIKVSPAVAVIGLVDTTRAAVRIGAQTYAPIPSFVIALLLYMILIGTLIGAQRVIVRKFSVAL